MALLRPLLLLLLTRSSSAEDDVDDSISSTIASTQHTSGDLSNWISKIDDDPSTAAAADFDSDSEAPQMEMVEAVPAPARPAVSSRGCRCAGKSNPHGFGPYCYGWEFAGQRPWCYVDASCPAPGPVGDYGKFDECDPAPAPAPALAPAAAMNPAAAMAKAMALAAAAAAPAAITMAATTAKSTSEGVWPPVNIPLPKMEPSGAGAGLPAGPGLESQHLLELLQQTQQQQGQLLQWGHQLEGSLRQQNQLQTEAYSASRKMQFDYSQLQSQFGNYNNNFSPRNGQDLPLLEDWEQGRQQLQNQLQRQREVVAQAKQFNSNLEGAKVAQILTEAKAEADRMHRELQQTYHTIELVSQQHLLKQQQDLMRQDLSRMAPASSEQLASTLQGVKALKKSQESMLSDFVNQIEQAQQLTKSQGPHLSMPTMF